MTPTPNNTHGRQRRSLSTWLAFGVGVLALGLVTAQLLHTRGRDDARELARVRMERDAMIERLAEIEAQLRAAQRTQAAPHHGATAQTPAATALAPSPEPLEPEVLLGPTTPIAPRDVLERRFEAEHVDPTWSHRAEAEVHAAAHKLTGTEVLDATCRSSLCRVELQFADREARERFQLSHVMEPPFMNTHILIEPADDSGLHDVLLVTRNDG